MLKKTMFIMLLAMSLIPLIYVVYFISELGNERSEVEWECYFKLHKFMAYFTWALIFFYQILIIFSKEIIENLKLKYSILLYLGNVMVLPFLCYKFYKKNNYF